MAKQPVQQDEWDTESGLPDDLDAWINRAYFGFNPLYMDGKVPLLIWECESAHYDNLSVVWAIGTGWVVMRDGASVEHEKGKKRFVNTSLYGRLIERMKDLGVDMSQYGSPREAATWDGLGFHLIREEIEFKGAVDRGILVERGGKTVHLMPTVFLGVKKDEKVEIPPVVEEKLVQLAKASPTVKQFQIGAMKIPEVQSNEQLREQVLDTGATGFYERARKQ